VLAPPGLPRYLNSRRLEAPRTLTPCPVILRRRNPERVTLPPRQHTTHSPDPRDHLLRDSGAWCELSNKVAPVGPSSGSDADAFAAVKAASRTNDDNGTPFAFAARASATLSPELNRKARTPRITSPAKRRNTAEGKENVPHQLSAQPSGCISEGKQTPGESTTIRQGRTPRPHVHRRPQLRIAV
jgi:hypothetical protein